MVNQFGHDLAFIGYLHFDKTGLMPVLCFIFRHFLIITAMLSKNIDLVPLTKGRFCAILLCSLKSKIVPPEAKFVGFLSH